MNQVTKQTSVMRKLKADSKSFMGRLVALLVLSIALPLLTINSVLSYLINKSVFKSVLSRDALGRSESVIVFTAGILRALPILGLVVSGKYTWLGLPRSSVISNAGANSFPAYGNSSCLFDDSFSEKFAHVKPGIFSLHGLRSLTGIPSDVKSAMREQAELNIFDQITLVLRSMLASYVYSTKVGAKAASFTLFDVVINNDTMNEAVQKILTPRADKQTKTTCFVNVNSFNIAEQNSALKSYINDADLVFADGSGVRLATRRAGIQLKDNVNGTDLLPVLCKEAISQKKSLFLLGAEHGVAEQTRRNLMKRYPGLRVNGTHHGFFDKENSEEVIEHINQSGADIVLVALGSPVQERWLANHKHQLNAQCALAVGGLFDFYSGRIPRSPVWMRELGLEWVYRLLQEPRKKFQRYVIGNPQFLLRCWTQLKPIA